MYKMVAREEQLKFLNTFLTNIPGEEVVVEEDKDTFLGGKYSGQKYLNILVQDKGYIIWMCNKGYNFMHKDVERFHKVCECKDFHKKLDAVRVYLKEAEAPLTTV